MAGLELRRYRGLIIGGIIGILVIVLLGLAVILLAGGGEDPESGLDAQEVGTLPLSERSGQAASWHARSSRSDRREPLDPVQRSGLCPRRSHATSLVVG